MEKQLTFFGVSIDESDQKYSTAAGAPVYVPKGARPHALTLVDTTKTDALLREIEKAQITEDEKRFLRLGAQRHLVFNYERIAEFYAHASPDVQALMERSALIIIDVDKAIENGYVRLSQTIRAMYAEEEAAEQAE